MNLVSRSRITLHFGAKAAKNRKKKTKPKRKENEWWRENLMNDFSVVFKEREQERGDKGNEKKPSEEALWLMSFFMWKHQKLHHTWQSHRHRKYIQVTDL